jgi:hypothetical protein
LSELKFVVKAKEYSEAQVLLLVSEHNKSWKQLLSEPLIEVIFFFFLRLINIYRTIRLSRKKFMLFQFLLLKLQQNLGRPQPCHN